ncbi:MAG: serine protease, partial [Proteobacteria bacterium]
MKFILCLSLFFFASCSREDSRVKIIGGEKTSAPAYFVSLYLEGSSQPHCGGSLIAENLVLTAAHCVTSVQKPILVKIGQSDLNKATQSIPVESVAIHERYNSNSIKFDLALLRLESKAKRVGHEVSLASESSLMKSLRVYGFGNLSRQEQDYPDVLHSVLVDEFPYYECQDLGGSYSEVGSDQICAGDMEEGLRDSCYGDSGGPMVNASKELVGIVSWGLGCGQKGKPGVYTRVSSYRGWIEAHAEEPSMEELSDLVSQVFYYSLFADDDNSLMRFSAAYGLWQSVQTDSSDIIHWWSRRVSGNEFLLQLIKVKKG